MFYAVQFVKHFTFITLDKMAQWFWELWPGLLNCTWQNTKLGTFLALAEQLCIRTPLILLCCLKVKKELKREGSGNLGLLLLQNFFQKHYIPNSSLCIFLVQCTMYIHLLLLNSYIGSFKKSNFWCTPWVRVRALPHLSASLSLAHLYQQLLYI